eukprot:1144904-Pelagomonas_calceolata.AAC.2
MSRIHVWACSATVMFRNPGRKARRAFARRSLDQFLVAVVEKAALYRWESLGGSFLNAKRCQTASANLFFPFLWACVRFTSNQVGRCPGVSDECCWLQSARSDQSQAPPAYGCTHTQCQARRVSCMHCHDALPQCTAITHCHDALVAPCSLVSRCALAGLLARAPMLMGLAGLVLFGQRLAPVTLQYHQHRVVKSISTTKSCRDNLALESCKAEARFPGWKHRVRVKHQLTQGRLVKPCLQVHGSQLPFVQGMLSQTLRYMHTKGLCRAAIYLSTKALRKV